MKKITLIISLVALNALGFSQATNKIGLTDCIGSAIMAHPLSGKAEQLKKGLSVQNQIVQKSNLPEVSWNGQARIQSESIGLEFDNPNFPSISIPLYSAQTTLDLKYILYDGGLSGAQKKLNQNSTQVQLVQVKSEIDKIKKEVAGTYLGILMTYEKQKVLENAKERIEDNIVRLEKALNHGIIQKSDLLQLQINLGELESQIYANIEDRKALILTLGNLTNEDYPDNAQFEYPALDPFVIDESIEREELQLFDAEKTMLDSKSDLIDVKSKPKVFAFGTAGTGYPNPLNFFNDQLSLYAVGGIGFSWQFFDWGKAREEKKLLKIQQDIIDIQKSDLVSTLNRYNEKYKLGILKYDELMNMENALIQKREIIAEAQKTKLEQGVIVPVEYLNILSDLTDSKLKLNQYKLEQTQLKLEYMILKGQL